MAFSAEPFLVTMEKNSGKMRGYVIQSVKRVFILLGVAYVPLIVLRAGQMMGQHAEKLDNVFLIRSIKGLYVIKDAMMDTVVSVLYVGSSVQMVIRIKAYTVCALDLYTQRKHDQQINEHAQGICVMTE